MSDPSRVLRVIVDPPADGAWNMAVDEALLLSDERTGLTIRFYQWEEPTLSLGYFQSLAEREQHPPSVDCPMVRRASGGGAILHDRELTYSMVAPLDQRIGAASRDLYDTVHHALCDVLSEWSIFAHLHRPELRERSSSREPFLCFLRRSSGDVLVGDDKICGSAQRRSKSRLLQHGSLLLSRSDYAPELPGLVQVCQEPPDMTSLREALLTRLVQVLRLTVEPSELSVGERQAATEISLGKFSSPKWGAKR